MFELRFFGAAAIACAVLAAHSTASACGGCFHQKDDAPSVVTDHRMVLSVSKTQTVLWDQVRYQGNPSEFAWVLPVGPGARVELARAEWLSALDIPTAPKIAAPEFFCPNGGTSSSNGGGGGGCGMYSAGVDYVPTVDAGTGPTSGFQSTGDVTVVDQSVVGPYVAVIIRGDSGLAISTWLTDNGFEIPKAIEPTLASYAKEKLDFLALRLRPGVGVQAMQPVRVVTPGADPTLPLRMVAAGTGAYVGLLLYVVSEGRYEATSYPNATIPLGELMWDARAARSNYAEVFAKTASVGNGAWVTEYSGHDAFTTAAMEYRRACFGRPAVKVAVPCPTPDAGVDAGDAGDSDAGVDVDAESDAAVSDAGVVDAGGCFEMHAACDVFDDDQVATKGMNPFDVTLTRLRTILPTDGLVDLRLGAAYGTVSSQLKAKSFSVKPTCNSSSQTTYQNPGSGCACDSTGSARGAVFPAALGLVALALLKRRRR